jgi:hypothetical protein
MSLPVDLFIRTETGKLINLRRDSDLNCEVSYDDRGDNLVTFQMCNWGNRLPGLDQPIFLRDNTYGVFWSGYAGQPKLGGFFSDPSYITGRGWRYTLIDDGWDESKIWAAGTTLESIVFEALSKCHNITGGIPLPGGLAQQIPENSPDFNQQTPEDVFAFVKNIYSYLGTPLIWQIKNNPLTPFADQPSLEMKFQDTAPRYRVRLTEDDKFNPMFDSDTVWNQSSVAYADGLVATDQAAVTELYNVIRRLRKKRVNANADIKGTNDANALAAYLVSRNNTLRPISTTLELHCDTRVEALYPATPAGTVGNWPHWLIRPHFMLRILNSTTKWGQFKNVTDWYIMDVKHNFQSGITTLLLGDPVVYEAFKLLQSYITNRTGVGIDSSVVNQPLRDADVVPVFGRTGDGTLPATLGEGSTMFSLDPDGDFTSTTDPMKPTLKHGAGIDPEIIIDYGIQVNFGREADSIGIKGYIQVIPSRILDWELFHTPPPGSNTIPTDTMTVKLHNVYPFTAGNAATTIATATIPAANPGATAVFSPIPSFTQKGKIGVEVTVPSSVENSGFQIALSGKKIYPDVGVNT